MTMRKNAKAYCPGPIKFLEMAVDEAQARVTLESHGKLLGRTSDLEALLKRKERMEKAAEEQTRYLRVPAPPAATRFTTRFRGYLTPADLERLDRAQNRRYWRQATHLRHYASCIAGNWGKTLTESDHMATVNVAKNLTIDKLFIKKHAAR